MTAETRDRFAAIASEFEIEADFYPGEYPYGYRATTLAIEIPTRADADFIAGVLAARSGVREVIRFKVESLGKTFVAY